MTARAWRPCCQWGLGCGQTPSPWHPIGHKVVPGRSARRHAADLATSLAGWRPPPAASVAQLLSLCWQAAAAAGIVEALLYGLAVDGTSHACRISRQGPFVCALQAAMTGEAVTATADVWRQPRSRTEYKRLPEARYIV